MKTKTNRPAIQIEVREHRSSTADYPAWLAIVTTVRGYCYYVVYAGDKPSEEKVRQAWDEDRKAFDPYS
jgi:hypothetical protein